MSLRVRPLLFAIATCIIGCNSEESRDDSSANDSADPVVIEDSHIDDLPTNPRLFGQEKGAAVLSSEDLRNIRELLKETPRTAESKITEIVELLDGTLEVNTVRNVSPPMGEVIHLTRSGPHRWRIEEMGFWEE